MNVIVGDNDQPGKALGSSRLQFFGRTLVFPPSLFKDLDEWILVDTLGLVLLALVTAGHVHDRNGAKLLMQSVVDRITGWCRLQFC